MKPHGVALLRSRVISVFGLRSSSARGVSRPDRGPIHNGAHAPVVPARGDARAVVCFAAEHQNAPPIASHTATIASGRTIATSMMNRPSRVASIPSTRVAQRLLVRVTVTVAVAGPTFRRRQLGIELRRLREAAGISPTEVADILGSKRTRVTYIEQGRNVVSKSELVVLVRDHFGAPERLAELEGIRQEADERGWWSTYGLSERSAG